MTYYVIEFQTDNGVGATIPSAFDNLADAEAKYHDILRVAAKSKVEKHGAMIITEDLFIKKQEVSPRQVNA